MTLRKKKIIWEEGNSLTSFENISSVPTTYTGVFKHTPVFLSPDYFTALENASPAGMSFRYFFYSEKNVVKGLFYFQIINLAAKELGKIINLEPYSKLLNHFSGVINTILFGGKNDKPHYLVISGNMMISGEVGIYASTTDKEFVFSLLPAVIDSLKTDLEKEGKVVATIVKDFESENDSVKKHIIHKGYSRMEMDPIMQMELNNSWKSFDDYTEALSAKYRLRCNNARKKMQSFTVRDLTLSEIVKYKNDIDILYKAVQHKSPVRLVKSDAEYLIELAKNLGKKFRFLAYFDNDKMIAFLCGINDNDHYEAHHIGIDYYYNRSHSVYLNILYEFISLAIEANAKKISFGRTALEMKTTVGAVANNYNAYLRLNNYMLNCLVKPFIPAEPDKTWTARNPFKQ